MAIQDIRILVKDELSQVNALIHQQVAFQHPLIAQMTQHLLDGGGKQLRPLLLLLTSKAFDYTGNQNIDLAAMIEFFHTATLLHDDVIDESKLRRGKETAHEIWGNKASVLVGDYLFTLHTQLLLKTRNFDILDLMTRIANQIGFGEIKQLMNRHQADLSIQDYFDVIEAKTSLLFAASASIGAIIAGQNAKTAECLYQYGLHLGNAFQLIDDALDYCSDTQTIGKNVGDDLADGKATLPVLHALEHGTTAQQEMIRKSLQGGLRENLPDILTAIKDTGAIAFTQETAEKESKAAIICLEILPESKFKDALIELAKFSVIRQH
ncbi:MAG: octaprenyl diphosphate synthase [Gammaproteobacteria bacterium]|nr:octaprenyl diphosphate synthase [Gammaproteobacteria bacterium]